MVIFWQNLDVLLFLKHRLFLFEVNIKELEQRVAGRRECHECSWTGNVASERPCDNTCPCCGASLQRRLDDIPENFRKRLKEFQDLSVVHSVVGR